MQGPYLTALDSGWLIHPSLVLTPTFNLIPPHSCFGLFPIPYICALLVFISGLWTWCSHSSSLMCLVGVPMNYLSLSLLGLAWQGLEWLELPVSHFQTQRVPGRSRVWQWPHEPLGRGRQWCKCSMDSPQHTLWLMRHSTIWTPTSAASHRVGQVALVCPVHAPGPQESKAHAQRVGSKGSGVRSPRAPGWCSCRSGSKSWPHIVQMLLPSGWLSFVQTSCGLINLQHMCNLQMKNPIVDIWPFGKISLTTFWGFEF